MRRRSKISVWLSDNAINLDGPLDVLYAPLAEDLEVEVGMPVQLLANGLRYVYAARFSKPFKPRSNVDAVAIDVVLIKNDIA